jgi:hypothetical protein
MTLPRESEGTRAEFPKSLCTVGSEDRIKYPCDRRCAERVRDLDTLAVGTRYLLVRSAPIGSERG